MCAHGRRAASSLISSNFPLRSVPLLTAHPCLQPLQLPVQVCLGPEQLGAAGIYHGYAVGDGHLLGFLLLLDGILVGLETGAGDGADYRDEGDRSRQDHAAKVLAAGRVAVR